ncbi:MAG: aminotransferase class I/II-fold pyridoxal phosphate-dependent enzyme, partial [Acidobacteriaceae bacterium]
LPPGHSPPLDQAAMVAVLRETAVRLRENYPYFHPLYAGQMLKPPHPIARAAYALAMRLNPNNHALDGGRASSRMEIDAVHALASMVGWTTHLGHLTSGGTFANLEALWIAGQLHPGKTILASDQSHYTHPRICGVLQLPFATVPTDQRGRLSLQALEARLQHGNVGTVVVTLGSTALGAVDPLPEILSLRERFGFRIHVDAAYGGYFTLASNLDAESAAAFAALPAVDSIVIDPHKHGLQPYGCGCVLFRDPSVGRFYQHNSPYTYFTSDELHLGEIGLECSRAGAAAVALWATQRALPLIRNGEFAGMLESCRSAAIELFHRLCGSASFVAPIRPQLDIVAWAVRGATPEESSIRARAVFDAAARRDLHLALVQLPRIFSVGYLATIGACLAKFPLSDLPPFRPHEAGTSGMDRPNLGSAARSHTGNSGQMNRCREDLACAQAGTPGQETVFPSSYSGTTTDKIPYSDPIGVMA